MRVTVRALHERHTVCDATVRKAALISSTRPAATGQAPHDRHSAWLATHGHTDTEPLTVRSVT